MRTVSVSSSRNAAHPAAPKSKHDIDLDSLVFFLHCIYLVYLVVCKNMFSVGFLYGST